MNTLKIQTLVIFAILLAAPCLSQETKVFYTQKDATINSLKPNDNFGSSATFNATLNNGKIALIERSLIEYDISSIPQGSNIISANLKLSGVAHQGENNSYISPLAEAWEENTVTWNNEPLPDDIRISLPQSTDPEEDYIVDLTSLCQLWVDGDIENHGLMMYTGWVSLWGLNQLAFASSDYSDSTMWPYLEIVYELPRPKLIAGDCGLTDMPADHIMTAEQVAGAEMYEFYVKEPATGYNESITKTGNSFSLLELGTPVKFETEYSISVRVQMQGQWQEFGDTCINKTEKSSYDACKKAMHSFSYSNGSMFNSASDIVTITIQLPPDVVAFNEASVTNASVSIDTITNPGIPVYTITNINDSVINLYYYVRPGCEYLYGTTQGLTSPVTVNINGTDVFTGNIDYQINSSALDFNASLSQNIINNMAHMHVPFERSFVYWNTSSDDNFTGVIEFRDTIPVSQAGSAITIDSVFLSSPSAGTVLFYEVINSRVTFRVHVSDVGYHDSIVFKEIVTLDQCPESYNPNTFFEINYGCDTTRLCKNIGGDNTQYYTVTGIDPADKPVLEYILLTPGYQECWADSLERILMVVNHGGTAESLIIDVMSGDSPYGSFYENNISDHPIEDFTVYRDSSGVIIPVPFTNIASVWFGDAAIGTDIPVEHDDTLYIHYYEKINCIDPADYDDYFNEITYMHWEAFPYVRLVHECYSISSAIPYGNGYFNATWRKSFMLNQSFNLLTGTMTNGDTAWFNVESSSLILGNVGARDCPGFVFDMDSSELVVELELGQGLGLADSNLFLSAEINGTMAYIYPCLIETNPGPLNFPGGNLIRAHFSFPDSMYEEYTSHAHGVVDIATQSYWDFFSDFDVEFRLYSNCCYAAPMSGIRESVFFNSSRDCPGECLVPLANVSDSVYVLCPGCLLPGWNISELDIMRTNFDYEDTDNNNYPDSFPMQLVDPNAAQNQHIMVGDTIHCHLSSFVTDGSASLLPGSCDSVPVPDPSDSIIFNFSNIGFAFDEIQALFQGEIMDRLQFLGGTGIYYDADNGAFGFTIPETTNSFTQSGKYALDLGMINMQSYGVPGTVDSVNTGDSLVLDLQFRAVDSLEFSGGNPMYGSRTIDAVINMSGTPYPGINILDDAGDVSEPDMLAMTPEERAHLSYWCTGNQGRIISVGVDFNYFQNLANFGLGHDWDINDYNPCYNTIGITATSDVGRDLDSYEWNMQSNADPVAWNSFSYEIRDLWMLDSVTFTFPDEYEVDRIDIKTVQLWDTDTSAANNVTGWNCYPMFPDHADLWHVNDLYTYNLSNAVINDTSVTIFPSAHFDQVTDFNGCDNTLTAYDETKRYRIEVRLKMKDYHLTPNTTTPPDSLYSYWSSFPGTTDGDTTIASKLINYQFTKPLAELTTYTLLAEQDYMSSDLVWDMQINTTGTQTTTQGLINNRAENSFLYFKSPDNNIVVDSVIRIPTGVPVPVVNIIDGDSLYGLGRIGCIWDVVDSAWVHIYASYDCSISGLIDSLYVIYGWNCYKYPDTLLADSVCFMDTTILYINLENTGYMVETSVDDNIDVCDTIRYDFRITGTMSGSVNNIIANMGLSQYGEFYYLPGSGYVEYNDSIVYLEPDTIWPDSLTWYLDSTYIVSGFETDTMHFVVRIVTSCGFGNEPVDFMFYAENYCGKPLGYISGEQINFMIGGYPDFDILDMSLHAGSLTSCGDSALISVTVVNPGTDTTGAYNTIEIDLPGSFNYSSGYPVSMTGQTATLNINSGINPGDSVSYEFYIINDSIENCGDYDLIANLFLASGYPCDTNQCVFQQQGIAMSDTTILVIQKPEIVFTGDIEVYLCNDSDPLIELDVFNNDSLASDSIFIDFYCIEVSGSPISPCLFWSESVASIAAQDTNTISAVPPNLCNPNCTEIMAVLSGNCLCENDTIIFDLSNAVLTPTISDIFPTSPCLYAGDPMYFGSITTGAENYLWGFGNGDTSSLDSAGYVFPTGGYYCITLEVSNVCNPMVYSETFYVLPDICACDSMYGGTASYDIPDSTEITSTEYWNYANYPSGEVFVEGDVFVKSGAVLWIDSVTVKFSPKGRIVVEPGGLLNLKFAATLTKLDYCDYMWQGIEVWGVADDPMPTGAQHGRVTVPFPIYNNVTIEYAHIGILLGKRNLNYICTGFQTEFDLDYSSGNARIHYIDFKNNGIGIKGLRKDLPYFSDILVDNCNFESSTLIDPLYNSNNTIHYPVPTYPFVYASPKTRTTNGIWLHRFDVDFTLDNNTFFNMDTCMKAIDTRFTVDMNSFDKASYGIYALHTFASVQMTHIIKNSSFDRIKDNLTNEGMGIYIENGVLDKIYSNEFRNSYDDIDSCDIAIQLDFTEGHEVTENRFRFYKSGIIANENITGYVGANEPDWEGNAFNNCYRGIETGGDNSSLVLRCNDHTPNTALNQYELNWDNGGTLADQGVNGTNPDDPAGNTFNVSGYRQINSQLTPYMYFHHDISVTDIYQPTLQTGSVTIDIFNTTTNYTTDDEVCFDINISPPLTTFLITNQPFSQLEEMNIIKNELNNTLNDLLSNIDGGETQELLDDITGGMPDGKLKKKLISHSPLSDTVIYTVMIEDVLSPGNFKNAMKNNLPVSNQIVEDFYDYAETLPPGIKNQLLPLQIENPGVETPAGIERELGQIQVKYDHLLGKIITALLDTSDYRKADAIALLEYDASIKSKIILFGTYLNDNDFVNAQRILNEIAATDTRLIAYFTELQQIVLDLYQQGKTVYEMEANDFDFVYNLALTCPPNPAVYNARAIVEMLTGEHIPECPGNYGTKQYLFSTGNEDNSNESILLGDNYPDPLSDRTVIPYIIPGETKGKIVITNILGETMEVIELKTEKGELVIHTGNWAKGIYYYSMIINNEIIDTKKMVIAR